MLSVAEHSLRSERAVMRRVESDSGASRMAMDGVYDSLEQAEFLLGFAQAGANDDAIVIRVGEVFG